MAVIAVTGLRAEARIARRAGFSIVCAGGIPAHTAAVLGQAIGGGGAAGIVSFGISGGLSPILAPGTLVCARGVIAADGTRYTVDDLWRARMPDWPSAVDGDVFGSDAIVGTAAEKAALHVRTGAIAVDLESIVVAQAATRAGLPFIVIRTIADPAQRDLPAAAYVRLTPDGAPNFSKILVSVLGEPGQIPGLIRLARDTNAALRALNHAVVTARPVLLAPR
jgi:hopanoid-associated phosphorylase